MPKRNSIERAEGIFASAEKELARKRALAAQRRGHGRYIPPLDHPMRHMPIRKGAK